MRPIPLYAAALAVLALAAPPVAADPALWHIRSATTDITLFGTMHALPPNVAWLTPRIASRVDAADTLVLETVLPDNPAALAPLILSLGIRPGLPPLADRVAPSKKAALLAGVAALGLNARDLDGMKTWLAAIAIEDGALNQVGLTQGAGVEATLTARMHAASKPIVGLESVEQQLRLFDGLSETDARALLDATVSDLATAKEDTNALVAYWQAGETEALANEFDKEFKATPALAKSLLADRNAAWADWIARRLTQPGTVFIAVGAGHLGGPGSVVARLQARGIAVERVP